VSFWLIVGLAALTYGSRALALVAKPEPPAKLRIILDRMPAPVFAALAATSLFDEGRLVDERTLVATAGAVLLAPTRSILLTLIGGLAGYGLATFVL
jgi:branched-subunit amino acid transport protein